MVKQSPKIFAREEQATVFLPTSGSKYKTFDQSFPGGGEP